MVKRAAVSTAVPKLQVSYHSAIWAVGRVPAAATVAAAAATQASKAAKGAEGCGCYCDEGGGSGRRDGGGGESGERGAG